MGWKFDFERRLDEALYHSRVLESSPWNTPRGTLSDRILKCYSILSAPSTRLAEQGPGVRGPGAQGRTIAKTSHRWGVRLSAQTRPNNRTYVRTKKINQFRSNA